MITIQKLPEESWRDYRNLRLEALQSDPIAFGSSYDEELTLSEQEWRKRINSALFALVDSKPVGVIVYIRESKQKTKHIVNIFGVYVSQKYRGQGIGKQLLGSVIDEIKKNGNIRKIKLAVNPEQFVAVNLYEKAGFEVVGHMRNELYVDRKFYDELVMEKLLETDTD